MRETIARSSRGIEKTISSSWRLSVTDETSTTDIYRRDCGRRAVPYCSIARSYTASRLSTIASQSCASPDAYQAGRPAAGTVASPTRDDDTHDGEIRRWQEGDWWIATDVDTGVPTRGESRAAALTTPDDAVAAHAGERGRAPTDEELREMGIDPEDTTTGDQEPPDVLD